MPVFIGTVWLLKGNVAAVYGNAGIDRLVVRLEAEDARDFECHVCDWCSDLDATLWFGPISLSKSQDCAQKCASCGRKRKNGRHCVECHGAATLCKHRKFWVLGSGRYQWCWACGAFRFLVIDEVVRSSKWIRPRGDAAENPYAELVRSATVQASVVVVD